MNFFKEFLVSHRFLILALFALFFIMPVDRTRAQAVYNCVDKEEGLCHNQDTLLNCSTYDKICEWKPGVGCVGLNANQCNRLDTFGSCQIALKSCQWIGPIPGQEDAGAGKSVGALQSDAASRLNPAGIAEPTQLVGRFIKILLAFIGSISLVLYIVSGFLWMTASGNTEKVTKAKSIMIWTTLGVVVMLASYMLTSFIFKSLGL